MSKGNQKIKWQIGDNHTKILCQIVINIVEYQGYVYGNWKGRLVGTFSINCNTWFVM